MQNISRCQMIVTSRFHGAVCALLTGVPVSIIGDNMKLKHLSEHYHISLTEKSALSEEKLIEMIDNASENAMITKEDKDDASKHIYELAKYLGE